MVNHKKGSQITMLDILHRKKDLVENRRKPEK